MPAAREVVIAGQSVIAVPHDLDNIALMRRHGFEIPSPIGLHYKWPKVRGLFDPYRHQKETAGFLTLNHRAYCLSEMGLGKTVSALWAADYLYQEDLIDWCLILSPLSTLRRVWADSIFDTFTHRDFAILHGTAAKRKKLWSEDYDFHIINHDGFEIIQKDFVARPGRGLVIIDELSVYRSAQSQRFKRLKNSLRLDHRVWGLTGAPIPNAPTDAWAQCKLVTPATVSWSFAQFRAMTMEQFSQFVWVPRREALQVVFNAMQPSIRFTRDECLDLPPVVHMDREVELTAEQKVAYKNIANELYHEYNGGLITAANEGVKLFKLVQAACGAIYDKEGGTYAVGAQPRLDAVMEICEESLSKVIIFVPFRVALNLVAAEVGKKYATEVIHGGISVAKRDDIFSRFQKPGGVRVLVADAGTMSHGLTLTEASTIIWYAPETSNDTYLQANARITREGQKHVATIVHLQGSAVERRIYKKLQERGTLQGSFLDLIAGEQ